MAVVVKAKLKKMSENDTTLVKLNRIELFCIFHIKYCNRIEMRLLVSF